jgi:hypothetical protein
MKDGLALFGEVTWRIHGANLEGSPPGGTDQFGCTAWDSQACPLRGPAHPPKALMSSRCPLNSETIPSASAIMRR